MNHLHRGYQLNIAGVAVPLACRFAGTPRLFGAYASPDQGGEAVFVEQAGWDFWPQTGKPLDAEAEASLFTTAVSDALLQHDRCIIHAVAFRFRDRAWLMSAASGVGKSTQIRSLQELYPGEFGVICGDRPALQLMDDGTVWVHPTPWNGKENWFGAEGAPLAGIFCLTRGEETRIARLKPQKAVLPLFPALISAYETKEQIRRLAAFEDQLLRRVPVYDYCNGGVPDSTRILYQTIFAGEVENHEI